MIGVWLRRWIINERVETHYFRRALVITEIINGVEVLAWFEVVDNMTLELGGL